MVWSVAFDRSPLRRVFLISTLLGFALGFLLVIVPSSARAAETFEDAPSTVESSDLPSAVDVSAQTTTTDVSPTVTDEADTTLYDADGLLALSSSAGSDGVSLASVTSYGVYSSLTASSGLFETLCDLARHRGPLEHYVLFRSGANEYTAFVGEGLAYENGSFSGSSVDVYRLYYVSSNYGGYLLDSATRDVSLSPSGYVVYSDMGPYPEFGEGDSRAVYLLMFALLVGCAVYLIHGAVWWSACRLADGHV